MRQSDEYMCNSCDLKRVQEIKEITQMKNSNKASDSNQNGLEKYVDSLSSANNNPRTHTLDAATPKQQTLPLPKQQTAAATTILENPTEHAEASNSTPLINTCNSLDCAQPSNKTECKCFICQRKYHIVCVGLKKRPSQKTAWSCPECRTDTNAAIRTLCQTVSSLQQTVSELTADQTHLKKQHVSLEKENHELSVKVAKLNKSLTDQSAPNDKFKTQLSDKLTQEIKDFENERRVETGRLNQQMKDLVSRVGVLETNHKDNSAVDQTRTEPESDNPTKTLILGDSMLRNIRDEHFQDAHVHSISGATLLDIIHELNCREDITTYRNIVIHCGTNDISNGLSTKDIVDSTEAAVTFIMITSAETSVHISAICPRDTHELNQKIESVNKELKKLTSHLGCGFIDAGQNMTYKNGGIDTSQFVDGLHLSNRGNETFLHVLTDEIPTLVRNSDSNPWTNVQNSRKRNSTSTYKKQQTQISHTHEQYQQDTLNSDELRNKSQPTSRVNYDKKHRDDYGSRYPRDYQDYRPSYTDSSRDTTSEYTGCFNCGLRNHNQRTCRYNRRVRCHACNAPGHKARYCVNLN